MRGIDKPVRIPSAIWKVVVYVDKQTEELACQAFVMYQDDLFCTNKRGKETLDITQYQVTITEIETLTGLVFDKTLFEKNPLYFFQEKGSIKDQKHILLLQKRKKGYHFQTELYLVERIQTKKILKRDVNYDDFMRYTNYLKA